jgi:hypothetical protein
MMERSREKQMTAKQLSILCRLSLAPLYALLGFVVWTGDRQYQLYTEQLVCLTYMLVMVGFLAFPKRRRNDICLATISALIILQVCLRMLGVAFSADCIIAEAVGMVAVYAPSHIDPLRKQMREFPWRFAFERSPLDRRRSPGPVEIVSVLARREVTLARPLHGRSPPTR